MSRSFSWPLILGSISRTLPPVMRTSKALMAARTSVDLSYSHVILPI